MMMKWWRRRVLGSLLAHPTGIYWVCRVQWTTTPCGWDMGQHPLTEPRYGSQNISVPSNTSISHLTAVYRSIWAISYDILGPMFSGDR